MIKKLRPAKEPTSVNQLFGMILSTNSTLTGDGRLMINYFLKKVKKLAVQLRDL